MTKPEFEVAKGNIAKKLSQFIELPAAIDLTGASAKLRFQLEGTTNALERAATLSNFSPSQAACRSFDATLDNWNSGDLDTAGRYEFQWKVTLADTTPLNLPESSPTEEDPDRVFQIMVIKDVV